MTGQGNQKPRHCTSQQTLRAAYGGSPRSPSGTFGRVRLQTMRRCCIHCTPCHCSLSCPRPSTHKHAGRVHARACHGPVVLAVHPTRHSDCTHAAPNGRMRPLHKLGTCPSAGKRCGGVHWPALGMLAAFCTLAPVVPSWKPLVPSSPWCSSVLPDPPRTYILTLARSRPPQLPSSLSLSCSRHDTFTSPRSLSPYSLNNA